VSKHSRKPTRRVKRLSRLTLGTVLAVTILVTVVVKVLPRQRPRVTGSPAETSVQVAKESKENFVTVKVAGQDVRVDGQTAQLQPLTPEQARKLAAGLREIINQSTEGLVQVRQADGSVSIDLEGRFQNVAVARVDRDGSVTQSCVDNPQAAGAFFGIDPQLIEGQADMKSMEIHQNRKVIKDRQ